MTIVEFESQIARLKITFGEKNFPSEKGVLYFAMVEECDFKPFEHQVAQWITDLKIGDPPRGEHFRAFAIKNHVSRTLREAAVNLNKEPECHDCSDRGWVSLSMKPEYLEVADSYGYPVECSAICDCSKGHKVKAWAEGSNDHKDIAKRQINKTHRAWYDITHKWRRQMFTGKSWEEFSKTREGSEVMT